MVTNKLSAAEVEAQAGELDLPLSVVEFLQGQLGQPEGGFPEPLRSKVLAKAGLKPINDRPGKDLPPVDFAAISKELEAKWAYLAQDGIKIKPADAISAALYPAVFEDYMKFREKFGDIGSIPTNFFLAPAAPGETINVNVDVGKSLRIKLHQVSAELDDQGRREVTQPCDPCFTTPSPSLPFSPGTVPLQPDVLNGSILAILRGRCGSTSMGCCALPAWRTRRRSSQGGPWP